jgi:PKD domain
MGVRASGPRPAPGGSWTSLRGGGGLRGRGLLCGLAALIVMAGAPASAVATPAIHSPLPGYPRFRGVTLVHDDSAASNGREQAIASAAAEEAAQPASQDPQPNCTTAQLISETKPGMKLCWWGGPVVKAHTVNLIFWEGPETEKHGFPEGYVPAVERYFENVASASGTDANVYAVGAQYGDGTGSGEYNVSFNKEADVYMETEKPLPASGTAAEDCSDAAAEIETDTERSPCVTDKDLHEEIGRARSSAFGLQNHWESSLKHIYFVFTPPEVGGCFFNRAEESERASEEANACAFAPGGYCSYHSNFGTQNEPTLYADLPDNGGVEGCDSFEHPNAAGGVDGTLDALSHEHNETITDPLGGSGWHDLIGNEMADKCVPPNAFEEVGGILTGLYGVPLGGSPAEVIEESGKLIVRPGTLYNEQIGSGDYWLQTAWSNAAVADEGGCVQRMVPIEFAAPVGARATTPVEFNGESSGEPGDPPYYWVWNFGDSMQVGTPEAKTLHTYALPGRYKVTLTVYDKYGNSNTVSKEVEVGEAPTAPPPNETTKTTTVLSTATSAASTTTVASTTTASTALTSAAPGAHYSAAQVAAALGLRNAGATLSGRGTITFGHGKCPPACSVTARLYAKLRATSHHHAGTKTVLIGTISETIADGGSGTVALKLNATGRSLLARKHTLAAQLQLTVTGAEGGTWQLRRSYTLSSGGKASRAGRKASARRRRTR